MKNYVSIGCTPTEESCFPGGHPLSRAEVCIYMRQLQRTYPDAHFRVRAFPHDFGTYHEVVAEYDSGDKLAADAAFDAEAGADHWDAIARSEYIQLIAKEAP